MKRVLILALFLNLGSAFANLVTNGTFDNNCAGWALAQTDSLTCSSTEGNPGFALILNNGPGPVPQASQTIAGLQIGTLYEIDWDAKTHYNCCNNPTVPGDGVAIDGNQFDFLIVNGQPWTSYSRQFTYSGGSNVLVLSSQRNGTDSDAEFDNVSITAVASSAPEPGSALLLGLGIAAIAAGRRRK